jgi:hypothetical protein
MFAFAAGAGAQILGTKPGYAMKEGGAVPNAQAVTQRIWAPALDEGFVHQGIAVDGRYLYVSAYRSADPKVNEGLCRVFRVEAETGRSAGHFDMPADCHHAGGLAMVGGRMLVVADTRQLWRIDPEKALAAGKAEGAIRGAVRLAGELNGSFVTYDGTSLWTGTYNRDPAKAKIHRLDRRVFDDFDGMTIKQDRALETLAIPINAQGAAFDKDGSLWIAISSSKEGGLFRIDRNSGAILGRHDVVIGVEGIDFDPAGRLWAVSEAGTRKWLNWGTHYPFIFALDVAKLK